LAEGHFDTLNTSVGRLNLNSDKERINTSTREKSISKESPNLILHRKVDHAKNDLHEDYYPNEVDHVVKRLQFNVLISGSPRVGKSQLINALCGGEKLAKTSASLGSCTTKVECYTLEDNQQQTPGINPFRINFYDTPGIESWIDQNGQAKMLDYIRETDPVCLIYCASPGSYANLDQLEFVLKYCHENQIFCALVCTNMWAGDGGARNGVLKDFEKELAFFGARVKKQFEQQHDQSLHEVIHFGDGALCTMVNSKEYRNKDFSNIIKPVQGIDELIHSIMEKLDDKKIRGWCHAVLYRRSYWEKIEQKAAGFVSARMNYLANNLLKYYYEVEIKNLQFNILIIGSPRVGKSQLINALFGDENLAKTSASLDSCTKEVKCYTMKTNKEQTPDIDLSEIHFYDTPGVESWTDEKGIMTMKKFLEDTNPICIIYCASPGSFVDLKQLHQLLEFCKEKQIFCALVCTNMWASVNQKVVMEEFERQLKFFGDRKEKLFQQEYGQLPHKVIFFGDGALCTMVNSKEYYDPEFSPVRKPVQGIDELIHCIMEKLDGEKLLGWCHAVLYHRSYWEKIKQKTAGFVSARMKNAANWSNMMFGPTAKNAAFFLKKFLE
jgi:ribosome biogenesis GTPase A